MKVVVHDYAGHPFQADLSRELARRGHVVEHLFFAEDPGPKGALSRRPGDPKSLSFVPISIGRTYEKGSMVARRFNDVSYGKRVGAHLERSRPDVVISGNTPTEAQTGLVAACKGVNSAFVYWVQDFYSVAATKLLSKKYGKLGEAVGAYYRWLERKQFRDAQRVVAITQDFVPLASDWAGSKDKVVVVENWGALGDIPQRPRRNSWAEEFGLNQDFVFLYAGTLGLKHNPDFMVELARRMAGRARVVIAGQGLGVNRVLEQKAALGLDNLSVLPVQPFERLPDMLGAGDVLVSVIEQDAGIFSVPSKVQSYMCAGRPVLLAAPSQNLAARVVTREAAGLVTESDDLEGFIEMAERLYADSALRQTLGANGRAFAERAYEVSAIANQFEVILGDAIMHKRGRQVRGGGVKAASAIKEY